MQDERSHPAWGAARESGRVVRGLAFESVRGAQSSLGVVTWDAWGAGSLHVVHTLAICPRSVMAFGYFGFVFATTEYEPLDRPPGSPSVKSRPPSRRLFAAPTRVPQNETLERFLLT